MIFCLLLISGPCLFVFCIDEVLEYMVAVFGPRGCFIAGGFERSLDFELLEAPTLALRFSSMLPLLFLETIEISKKFINV